MEPAKFFNRKEKIKILKAIEKVENFSSGEIKLHIENHCNKNEIERACEIFQILELHKTENKNGVLIYIAMIDKKIAIIGDKEINEILPNNFWEDEVKILIDYFKNSNYIEGIEIVINAVGEKLKHYFPNKLNYFNELSDEISFFNN